MDVRDETLEHAQAGGHVIAGEIVAAAGAELV